MGIEECLERQYEQIKKCYDCNGYDKKCHIYASQVSVLQDDSECIQSGTIRNDLIKIKQRSPYITYPVLKRILNI